MRTVRDPMIVLGGDLRVRSANPAFYRYFQVDAKETEGQLLYDLGNGHWDIPELRKLLEELLPERQARSPTISNSSTDFPQIGGRCILLNAHRIDGDRDRPELILLAFEDMTERKERRACIAIFLVTELSHRVKNSLAVVQSIAAQTLPQQRRPSRNSAMPSPGAFRRSAARTTSR